MNGRGGRSNNRSGRTFYGGRGHGRDRRGNGNSSKIKNKFKELKFAPHHHTRGQPATYATVKEAIVGHIQKSYDKGLDVASSIEVMEKMDLTKFKPTRVLSTKTDPAEKSIEQDGLDIEYKESLSRYLDRVTALDQGLGKAYALIFDEYCTKSMQSRIEEHPDFDSKIKNDPIALLNTIKNIMHTPVRSQYPFATLTNALRELLNMRQREDEILADYIKRFKQVKEIVTSIVGTELLDKFVENSEAYKTETDSTKQKEMKDNAYETWVSYLLIEESDQAKYGTLMKGFVSQFSLGNDQYPTTLTGATDALSNHRFDQKYHSNRLQRKEQRKHDTDDDSKGVTSFAQKEQKFCYCCGDPNHIATHCHKRGTTKRADWWINEVNKAHQQHLQNDDEGSVNDDTDDEEDEQSIQSTSTNKSTLSNKSTSRNRRQNRRTNWSGFQRHHRHFVGFQKGNKQTDLENVILLDTGSTLRATMMNPDFVTNIKMSKNPVGMHTNAGAKPLKLQADVLGYCNKGEAWFDSDQMTNIFGFSHMADEYHITYDNEKEDAFIVRTKDGIRKFTRTPEGLYAFKPSKEYIADVAKAKNMEPPVEMNNMISTVKENRKGYTQRQFDAAKRARKLYHSLGCPTTENFKAIIRMKVIKNCPVTVDDINIAERIFGPDIGTLKGKTTRRNIAKAVKDDYVEIPKEILKQHNNLTLCIDIMYVNGLPMLTAIDRSIRYRSLVPLDSRTATELYHALDVIFRFYNKAGIFIKTTQCDQEFKPLMDEVKDELDMDMNYTTTGEHESTAERNNRTIGERIRSAYHNLPYKAIPLLMLKYLAMVSTYQLNLLPAKGGASEHYSPHVLMGKRDLDYNKDLQIPFGAYVQAYHHEEPINNNGPRTIDAIYLRPTHNKQGGHELMNLSTGKLITRPRCWEVPVTDIVIKTVEKMAAKQGVKSLKLTNRSKTIFYPADWIAGVDYHDPIIDDDEDIDDANFDDDSDSDEDLSDEEYDDVDEEELEDLLAEPSQHRNGRSDNEANPTDSDNEDNENDPQEIVDEENIQDADVADAEDSDEDEPPQQPTSGKKYKKKSELDQLKEARIEPPSQPSRERVPRSIMNIKDAKSSRSYDGCQVTFEDEKWAALEQCHNIIVDEKTVETEEYTPQEAVVLARNIVDINKQVTIHGACFVQQYTLQKGLKIFKKKGRNAAVKEVDQLHRRIAFTPISIAELTPEEKRKAQKALMFLSQKRDGSLKGRCVYNGKPTRQWLTKEDSSSPTVSNEGIFVTTTIDAKEGRDVMTNDLPNAYIQTQMPKTKKGEERVIMKFTGVLVDLLVELAPEVYADFVVYENGEKVLYVVVLRAIYGMLVASVLWYKKLRGDLESIGFEFNPYDPCIANRMIKGKQHTVRFHVDDLMSSHVSADVNTQFHKWLNKMYGAYGEVKATRGTKHDYLGMTFDFSEPGKVKIDMIDYINSMIDDFPVKLGPNDTKQTPASEDLFAEGSSEKLPKKLAEDYHTFVAKGLFACKRTRPDIHTAIAILCTRVKAPNQDDWRKLTDLMRYLNGTRNDKLILSADNLHIIKWWVDAAFAVHPDFKSHTGAGMTLGKGIIQSQSRKQKLNTKSSTEAELVGVDDVSTMILWTKLFMEAQGYEIKKNILYQDNKSTILLENNGKRSSSKRTRAINIRYFFITDQIEKGNVTVEYCPTEQMLGDFWTKPKQGTPFQAMKKKIMGH